MQLFYHPEANRDSFVFDKDESSHIVKVLRKGVSDELLVTDGKGGRFRCTIIEANPKGVRVVCLDHSSEIGLPYHLTIAIAPTKNRDRLEWFVEKAVEIGVSKIIPIICDHSERKVQKTDRLRKISVAAMKQSLRYHLPEIAEAISIDEMINKQANGLRCVAHLTEGVIPLTTLLPSDDVLVVIGPEGDFSPIELENMIDRGYQMVTLNNHRLRTETAGLVAVQAVACV